MAQKVIEGNKNLGQQIRSRRNELGLTIEEAASRAGVGTKTWCRYEAGESIRKDKCKGLCKALNWHSFPNDSETENENISIQEYKTHEAWSSYLENTFGMEAAFSFAAGSDILYDRIKEDMEELSRMPSGTHIGQLTCSWLNSGLPEQFLTLYNYEFLYQLKCSLLELRSRAKNHLPMTAHSVMEELLIYLCNREASALLQLDGITFRTESNDGAISEDWIFDLFDDMDLITFLYSDLYLDSEHPYHFSHWQEKQFFIN